MKFADKLKSRKFLAAVIGLITGLAVVFGVDEGIVSTISGAVVSAASLIAYIAVEGNVDAAAVGESIRMGAEKR